MLQFKETQMKLKKKNQKYELKIKTFKKIFKV